MTALTAITKHGSAPSAMPGRVSGRATRRNVANGDAPIESAAGAAAARPPRRGPERAADCSSEAILIRPDSGLHQAPRPSRSWSPRSDASVDKEEDLDRATGTQLLDRAVAVLKVLGQAGETGARASAIAEAVGLKASTAHRIISALERHNLIEREHATKQYRLSVALFALGSQAAERTGLRRVCRPALLRLAAATGDTVFLMARTGVNTVCIDRHEGTYMIASLTGQIGGQIPVGVGPASQAILACLPRDEAEAVVAINANRYPEFNGLSAREVLDELPRIQARGYAIDDGRLVEGISAIAAPIRPSGRDVVASISIDMTSARLSPDRRDRIVDMLKREVGEIETVLTAPRRRRAKS